METVFTTATDKPVETQETLLEHWVRVMEARDIETKGHTYRVTGISVRLASALGLKDEALLNVRNGALLHNIGKLNVSDSILHKKEPLNQAEMRIVRTHPKMAYEMLKHLGFPEPVLEIPYCHHEKWDGTGYPRSLKDEQIPVFGTALCDRRRV